jgi:hypothetical protein
MRRSGACGKFDESVEHAMLRSAFARGRRVADEIERTRLITDISRLIRGSTVPEGARMAGLTLIGWLARRRVDEAPHAVGIEEARESERRMRASRAKAR